VTVFPKRGDDWMGTSRLEAFSDGVIAVIITIMVLELKVPQETTLGALRPLCITLSSYVLSFLYVGIYWNNHHHMLHTCEKATGRILWANLHLLFWLSLIPFATAWMGEKFSAAAPAALYGAVLFLAAIAYVILQQQIIASQPESSLLKKAVGKDWKGKVSLALYVIGISAAFRAAWISQMLYALTALIWLVPDRRIERVIEGSEG
jgi:TMEM175 potassium channel family protein